MHYYVLMIYLTSNLLLLSASLLFLIRMELYLLLLCSVISFILLLFLLRSIFIILMLGSYLVRLSTLRFIILAGHGRIGYLQLIFNSIPQMVIINLMKLKRKQGNTYFYKSLQALLLFTSIPMFFGYLKWI